MPQVPRYQPQVREQGLPSARITTAPTAETFGGGRLVGQVADMAEKLFLEEKKKADDLATLNADLRAGELENRLLYDPEAGALNKRGRDAFGLPEQVMSEYDKEVEAIDKELTNDTQRIKFRQMSATRRLTIDRTLQRHVSTEIKQYDDTTTENYVKTAADAAALNYNDPQRIGLELERMRTAYVAYADRHGLPAEWVKTKTSEAASRTHTSVIDRMLANGLDLQAKEYLEAARSEINGEHITRVEKAVNDGSLRGESQRQADAIVAAHTDRLAALEAVTKIADPKLRDATEERVQRFYSAKKQAEAERRNDTFMAVSKRLEKNGGNLDVVSPMERASMDSAQLHALEVRSRQLREGVEPPQNDRVWLQLLSLSATDLGKLSEAELMTKYRPHLDNAHWDQAAALWSDASGGIKGNKDAAGKYAHTMTFKDRVDNTLRSSGLIDPNKSMAKFSNEEATMVRQFMQEADKGVKHYEQTVLKGQRAATEDEMQKIIDGLATRRVFVDRVGRDKEKPAVLLSDDERARSYVPIEKVPRADRNTIENLIRSKGRRVTEDKVQRAYAQYIMGNRAAFDAILGE